MDESEGETRSASTMRRRDLLLMTIGFEGGLLAVSVVLGYLLGVRFWETSLGSGWGVLYGIGLSIPMIVGVVMLAESSWPFFRQTRIDLENVVKLLGNCGPMELLVISLLAGVCEEALFRGLIQEGLAGYMGMPGAIAIASILFGLAHALSISYFLFATAISVYLGIVYVVFDGLAAPVALHAAYDFVALMYAIHLRPIQGRIDT